MPRPSQESFWLNTTHMNAMPTRVLLCQGCEDSGTFPITARSGTAASSSQLTSRVQLLAILDAVGMGAEPWTYLNIGGHRSDRIGYIDDDDPQILPRLCFHTRL